MKNVNKNNPDGLFRDRFQDFEPDAPSGLWDKIDQQLFEEEIDATIMNEFSSFEVEPDEKIWKNVKTKLPLSLLLRNSLDYLVKIAAVLVVCMLVILQLNKKQNFEPTTVSEQVAPTQQIPTPLVEETVELEEEKDFVYEIKKKKKKKRTVHIDLEESDEIDVDAFLDLIFDDENEFAEVVNPEIIEEALSPAEALPKDGLAFKSSDTEMNDDEIEFEITVPLQVVDENEIEALLEAYDKGESQR